MSRSLRVALAVAVAVVVGLGVLLVVDRSDAEPARADNAAVVRDDSHRLGPVVEGAPTLVEFLDFECEACRAVYPAVEALREKYTGRINFVVRYFPLPSHVNAERAARAVEAAAGQGQFEQMYTRMYETQAQWGEQRGAMDDTFRAFAADLNLDMARWDTDYQSASTLARIRRDVADGLALGVQGTPTFYLDGKRLEPDSLDDFTAALDSALR